MKHPITCIVAMVGWHMAANAQLNESDTARLQLRAGLSGSLQKGNVDLLLLRSRLEVTAAADSLGHWVYKTQNNHLYQAFGGRPADNDLNSRHYLYYNPTKRIYPFVMVYLQTNYRRKLNYRLFGGTGLTLQVVRTASSNIKLSGSMLYETNGFEASTYNNSAYNGKANINLWRSSFYVAGWHQLAQKKLRLFYTAYFQPGMDGNTNNRSSLELGIDIPVWNGLGKQVTSTCAKG